MKGRSWGLLILAAFLFSVGSFFFFLGSLLQLFSEPEETGNVAIVEVLGGIFEAKSTVEQLADLKKQKDVKAVVLRVDSPGGSVSASQEIFESVKDFKGKKPIVVSMGNVAASGGYYISAPATKILANPGTITGSIGVRMELLNIEDLAKWARLRPLTLKSGRLKDVGSPTRPMTPDEREYLEGILKEMHRQFKKAVAESRGLTLEEVDRLSDGRVMTGEEALEKKLIDGIGTLDKAAQMAGELAGVKGEPEIFYPTHKEKRFWDYIIEGIADRLWNSVLSAWMSPMHFSYQAAVPERYGVFR